MSSLGLDPEPVLVTKFFFPNVVVHVILIGAVMIDSCIPKTNDAYRCLAAVIVLWLLQCNAYICIVASFRMSMNLYRLLFHGTFA